MVNGNKAVAFEVYGPVDVPTKSIRPHVKILATRRELALAWRKNQELEEKPAKRGCYIFAIKAPRGYQPIGVISRYM